ncbi:hypothetical protein ESCO_001596 [Escovopsis weberi]|uniref:F-box domain-containing protein n=1 Tax=Escovopsis weberi TaxID=150374 RepID=A0A0M9VWQ4_ESCWE|nr:hypothetical protein ESCO_001596 [Escovopsis weberi]
MSEPLVRSSSNSSGSSQECRNSHTSSSSLSSMSLGSPQPLSDKKSSSPPSSPESASVRPARSPIPKRYLPRPRRVAAKPPAFSRSLLDLPVEMLLTIAHGLTEDRDLHALSKTCRRLYALLNADLYLLNSMFHNASALAWAARTGNVARTQQILNLERVESTATLVAWRESLHLVARRGHCEIVRLLRREEPVACELARPDGECRLKPLTYAAAGRQTEMLRFLLATLPRVDRRDASLALRYAEFLGEGEAAWLLRDMLSSPAPAADAFCVPLVGEVKKRGGRILVTGF